MTEQRQRELRIQPQDARTVIRRLSDPEEDAPRLCRLKLGSGSYDHLDQCPGSSNPEPLSMCPFEKIHESERKLRGLEFNRSVVDMHEFLQILHKQYYTNGTWQTRECYPWEYDTKIQELLAKKPSYFTTEDDCKWFGQQAKILQNRAHYIRQQQANELFKQQLADIHATFQATLQQLATQQSTPPTPPAPQEAQKEEDEQLLQQAIVKEDAENTAEKQEQQPLYQATVEDITESTTESTTKHGSSMPDSKSTLSTIPRLCTARSSGDSAACLSNTRLLACQHTMFLSTLPGYIEHSDGIEATGQG